MDPVGYVTLPDIKLVDAWQTYNRANGNGSRYFIQAQGVLHFLSSAVKTTSIQIADIKLIVKICNNNMRLTSPPQN
jgi:hypothetical protein